MSKDGDNFYVILDLDPSVRHWARIDAQIQTMRSKWSKEKTTHPSDRIRNQAARYLDLFPEIQRVMKNDALRQQEALEAVKLLEAQRRDKLKKLHHDIDTLAAKGYILESEVAKLIKRYQKERLTESEIRKEIKIQIRSDDGKKQPKVKSLEKATIKSIEDNLSTLGCKELYEFLGLSRNASLKALVAKATDIDREIRKHAKKTPDISAKGRLVGHCKVVFGSEDSRKSYELAMSEAGLSQVTDQINLIGADTIDQATYQKLLKLGLQSGASEDQTRRHIRKVATKKGKDVEVPSRDGDQFQQCGYCGAVGGPKDVNCHNCGQPLTVPCPMSGCSAKMPSAHSRCTKCGFPIGDLPEIQRRLSQAQVLADGGGLEDAQREVQTVQRDLLPQHTSYPPADKLLRQVAEALQSRKDDLAKLRKLVRDRRMAEADQFASKMTVGRSEPRELSQLKAEISKAMKDADRSFQAAVRAEAAGKFDEAFDHCSRVLSAVADHRRAQGLMSKYPPEPPGPVTTEVRQAISLKWRPSPSQGSIEYRIVRKEGSAPSSAKDGQTLGSLAAQRYDDDAAEPGASYYYSVFAVRAGVESTPRSAGPVMRVADVQNLSAKPGDGVVNLSWTSPKRTVRFEVWRTEGKIPTHRRQGTKVQSVRNTGLTDENLKNGTTYGYLVVTLFQDEDGSLCASRGVSVTAIPEAPPEPLRDLTVRREGPRIALNWKEPKHGKVEIYRLPRDPDLKVGEESDIRDLSALGKKVAAATARSAKDTLGSERAAFYLPVTVAGSVGVIGEGRYVTAVDDVTDLRGSVSRADMLLKWRWPSGTKRCRVAVRTDRFAAGPDDPHAAKEDVSLSVYESRGGHYSSIPKGAKLVYVSVHAAVSVGDDTVFAAGSSEGSRISVAVGGSAPRGGVSHGKGNSQGRRTIRYRIVPASGILRRKPPRVIFKGAGERTTLPKLCVVTRYRNVPVSLGDGQVIATFPEGEAVEPHARLVLEFSAGAIPQNTLARLFAADPSDADWLELIPERPRMDIASDGATETPLQKGVGKLVGILRAVLSKCRGMADRR